MANLTVQMVSELSGVKPSTLRAWENRYGAVKPDRTNSKRRVYSSDDLDKIRLLKTLVDSGCAISQVANLPLSELKNLTYEMQSTQIKPNLKMSLKGIRELAPQTITIEVKEIVDAIKKYDFELVDQLITRYRLNLSPEEFVLKLCSPLFGEIGKLYEQGKLNISQEHIFSAILRDHLSYLRAALQNLVRFNHETIALCTPSGHRHEFGVILSEILVSFHSYKPFYLGPDYPAEPLYHLINKMKLKTLILGVTKLPPEHSKYDLDKYLREIDNHVGHKITVYLGGPQNHNFSPYKKINLITVGSLTELNDILKTTDFKEAL